VSPISPVSNDIIFWAFSDEAQAVNVVSFESLIYPVSSNTWLSVVANKSFMLSDKSDSPSIV